MKGAVIVCPLLPSPVPISIQLPDISMSPIPEPGVIDAAPAPVTLPMVNLIPLEVEEFVMRSLPLVRVIAFQNFFWSVFTVTVELLVITSVSLEFQVVGVAQIQATVWLSVVFACQMMPSYEKAPPLVEPEAIAAKRLFPKATPTQLRELGSVLEFQVIPSSE